MTKDKGQNNLKNQQLAQWLEDHTEMLGATDNHQDSAFHAALYESVISMVQHDETEMVNSVLDSAAAHAVAVGRGLTDLLSVPQRLRERIWRRIGEEIDPEPAFAMLTDVDAAFVHIIRVIIDAYEVATKLAHGAKAAEISRLYTDSEQKVMEYAAEVARANRELAQLEQAKTDFISIAAHELKTPLTLIQGYVNILSELAANEQMESLVQGINRGTARMGTILDDMLDLSAIDMNQLSLVIEPVNLKVTFELIANQLQKALVERKLTVDLVDLENLPFIQADPQRLYQVFRQIFANAIKYTPDGGQLAVTCRVLPTTYTEPARIQLTIRDTGVGVAPEDREKIFEKFYRVGDSKLHSTGQTKFMGAGPGLGLAIAKGLVEAHGGKIWVESPGFDIKNTPGSAFHVILPTKAEPSPGVEISRPP